MRFEIACATVDPQTVSFDPSPLIPYVQSLGIQYHFLSEPIVELAKSKLQGDSLCAFCARFKRGLLYSCCRRFRYNKLVLAQHLDDLAESFFMSALHNGQVGNVAQGRSCWSHHFVNRFLSEYMWKCVMILLFLLLFVVIMRKRTK